MIALTWPRLSSVTIPSRRYQTPSRVRQTSSAYSLLPVVRRIVVLPFLVVPGPLVEIGVAVVVVCAVAMRSVVGLVMVDGVGVAVGVGDAVVSGEGEGIETMICWAVAIGVAGD